MPLPLLPMAIVSLAGGAWYAQKRRSQPIDPSTQATRELMYDQAVNGNLTGKEYRVLAKTFRDDYNMPIHADMLVKRAELQEAPAAVKIMRRQIIAQALASTKADAIRNVAAEFERLGAIATARDLNAHAAAVEQAQLEMSAVDEKKDPPAAADDETDAAPIEPSTESDETLREQVNTDDAFDGMRHEADEEQGS